MNEITKFLLEVIFGAIIIAGIILVLVTVGHAIYKEFTVVYKKGDEDDITGIYKDLRNVSRK